MNQPDILRSLWKKASVVNDQQAVFREDTRNNKLPTCPPSRPSDKLTSKLFVKDQTLDILGCALCSNHLVPQLCESSYKYYVRNGSGCCIVLLELPKLRTAGDWVASTRTGYKQDWFLLRILIDSTLNRLHSWLLWLPGKLCNFLACRVTLKISTFTSVLPFFLSLVFSLLVS